MNNQIVARRCSKSFESNTHKLSCEVNWLGEEKLIWLTYPREFDEFVDEQCFDWVLAALLIPAMATGADLHISGTLSSQLYLSATTDIQKILASQNRKLSKINITFDKLVKRKQREEGFIGTGFSAGIDSLSSIMLLEQQPSLRPTHLATMNVGAMGPGEFADRMMEKYAQRLSDFCHQHNYSPLLMDSNIHSFYEGFTHQLSHTLKMAAAVLALGGAFSYYYYSSTWEYSYIGVRETYDVSISDPILLPMLSSEATQFRAIGTHLSRMEKVKMVGDYLPSYEYLDVCIGRGEQRIEGKSNCSSCRKCVTQLMTLELLGKSSEYQEVFDVEAYRKNREKLVYEHVLRTFDLRRSIERDVIELAQHKGVLKKLNIIRLTQLANLSWKLRNFLARKIARDYVVGIDAPR